MASWLKRLLFRDDPATAAAPGAPAATGHAAPADQPPERDGLNFETAISAHMAWKKRLDDLLDADLRDVLDPLQVCRDDQCELGRWLHGPGALKHGQREGYQRLRAVHADFHQAAARVVTLAQAGQDAAAREEMTRGSFAKCSAQVKAELARLYLDIGH